jgi:hypothetical protein
MLMARRRARITASLLAATACGGLDRGAISQAEPAAVAIVVGAADRHEGAALGTAVAALMDQASPAKRSPGPNGGDLDVVEQIEVTRLAGGWVTEATRSVGSIKGAVLEIDADVKVGPDIGLNEARVVAKASCVVDDERRASAADVYALDGASGHAVLDAEPGEHEHAFANLFAQDTIAGHLPCQVELKLSSRHSDRPLRIPGVWCIRDGGTEPAPCPELAPVVPGEGVTVRDWAIDHTHNRTIELTVRLDERVWLDRELALRSSCDRGGERMARLRFASGRWGVLDPGDSVRVKLSEYQGWFAAERPCELTLEWWRTDKHRKRVDREQVASACVRKFLPEDGPCYPETVERPAVTAMTLRTLAASIETDAAGRHLVAEVEALANEDIDGRWALDAEATCGRGRRRAKVWMWRSGFNIDPTLLRADEVAIGTLRGELPASASRCELEVRLTPQVASAPTPISLGKLCVTRSRSKPC